MTLTSGVGLVVTAITLLSAAGSAVAFYRANLATATIAALRGDRDDLQARTDRQAEEIAEQAAAMVKQEARITALERENKMLRGLATGADAIDKLAIAMTQDRAHCRQEHHDLLAMLETCQTISEKRHGEVVALVAALRGAA